MLHQRAGRGTGTMGPSASPVFAADVYRIFTYKQMKYMYHAPPHQTHPLWEYVTSYKVIKNLLLTPTLFPPYELRIVHDFENFFLFMFGNFFKVPHLL